MGTTSRLIEVLPGQMREIALRLKRLREDAGLTQEALAERCLAAARELLGPEDRPRAGRITRSRIAHIEQAHQTRPGKGAAMTIQPHEVRFLAHALGVSPEQIVGEGADRIVTWDPLTHPQRAAHFLSLVGEHGRNASALLSWAEFLPCSLETPAFMHAHHEAIFDADAVHLPPDDRAAFTQSAVRMYDTIGDRRRQELLDSAASRSWTLTHMMLRSDLESIASGVGPYAGMPASIRREGLRHLVEILGDPTLRVTLVVADDAAGLRHLLQGIDSVAVFDETFAFWRGTTGDVAYSAHAAIVRLRRGLLETFRAHASHRDPRAVIRLLNGLVADVPRA